MYPFFELYNWIFIYSFGFTLTICFFLFLWMLNKLSLRFGINQSFFFNRILWYFLSVFIFSRLFYVIWKWNEFKFIDNPLEFFIMSDYNFSLFWAIFWFLIILFLTIRIYRLRLAKYLDVSVLSFLFVSIFWYIWAFLWWQVYGKETNFGIEILYTTPFSPVPFEVPIFPLALVYSIVSFFLFSIFYMLVIFIKTRWIIWYLWLICFSAIVLFLESFSWKNDIFYNYFFINLSQISAIVLIIFSFIWLIRLWSSSNKIESNT